MSPMNDTETFGGTIIHSVGRRKTGQIFLAVKKTRRRNFSLRIALLQWEQVDLGSIHVPAESSRWKVERGRSTICGTPSISPSIFRGVPVYTSREPAHGRTAATSTPSLGTPLGKVVYPSSFNYLINSGSSIIFACVIKPPTKVNNLRCTSNSRSSR